MRPRNVLHPAAFIGGQGAIMVMRTTRPDPYFVRKRKITPTRERPIAIIQDRSLQRCTAFHSACMRSIVLALCPVWNITAQGLQGYSPGIAIKKKKLQWQSGTYNYFRMKARVIRSYTPMHPRNIWRFVCEQLPENNTHDEAHIHGEMFNYPLGATYAREACLFRITSSI